MGDFELLKEVPGYKAILKVVLKSQIQLLIDQLCKHTGEESFVLTANASDGAQSLLGSGTGKGFLENRSEIKTQFLGHCLKSLHNQAKPERVLHNDTRYSRVRVHPYERKVSSSPPSQYLNQYNEKSVLSDIGNVSNSGYKQLNHNLSPRDSVFTTIHRPNIPTTENSLVHETHVRSDTNSFNKRPAFETSGMDFDEILSNSNCVDDSADDTKQSQNEEGDCVMVKTELESDEIEVTGVELGNQFYSGEKIVGQFNSDSNQTAASPDNIGLTNSEDMGGSLDLQDCELETEDRSASKHYFPCRYCGRVFQHNSWLTRHIRSHTGEKPYECRVCGKRFTRSGTMKVHTLMHTIK